MRRNWSRIWAIGQLRVNIFSHFLQVPSKQRLRASFVRQNFRSIYSIGAAVYSGVGQFLRWMGEVIAGKNRRESGSRASPPSAADNWAPRHAARSPAALVMAIDQLDTEAGSAAWRFRDIANVIISCLCFMFFWSRNWSDIDTYLVLVVRVFVSTTFSKSSTSSFHMGSGWNLTGIFSGIDWRSRMLDLTSLLLF